MICNLPDSLKIGSMGKPAFLYDIVVVDGEGNELPFMKPAVAVRMHSRD
jgi:acetyl-CoA synthetase